MTATKVGYRPVGHVVFRSPLMSLATLDALTEAAQRSPGEGRAALKEFLHRPEVFEALTVASPSLVDSMAIWEAAPESERGRKVERALMSYVQRMCTRCTPFGLFAAVTVGKVGKTTLLAPPPQETAKRKTRIDMGYLYAVCEKLLERADVRARVRFFSNETVLRVGERLHFVTAKTTGARRVYALSAVDALPALTDLLLPAAQKGLTRAEVATTLQGAISDLDTPSALGFVDQLIDAQLLVPQLSPLITGAEAIDDLLGQLEQIPECRDVYERLADARRQAAAIDARGIGQDVKAYRDIQATLEPIGVPCEPGRILQVDLARVADGVEVSEGLIREVMRVSELLAAAVPSVDDGLQEFKRNFTTRYEGGEVPLLRALDEEAGVGFLDESAGQGAPLLDGIYFQGSRTRSETFDEEWSHFTIGLLQRAKVDGAVEVNVTEKELDALKRRTASYPESFVLMMEVLGGKGGPAVQLSGITGPSSEFLLGRFAWLDPSFERAVAAGLRAEEALRPEARFAELVHAPEGRQGNVIARPAVRNLDIPILSRSGLPQSQHVALDDLTLQLINGRLVLRSKRLGCEVVPRLSNAHNASAFGLPVYRFLAQLQGDGTRAAHGWNWGKAGLADWVPRVRVGRVVVAPQRWTLTKVVLGKLETVAQARDLAARLKMPRFVEVRESDNTLPVDWENPLSVEAFIDSYGNEERILVTEDVQRLFGSNTHTHELQIAMVATERTVAAAPAPRAVSLPRVQAPTGDWLYSRIDIAPALADRFLQEVVTPFVERLRKEAGLQKWFFIRYTDQGHHLRLRFQADKATLLGRVIPWLGEAVDPWLGAGIVPRWSMQTYVREIERYGGDEGMTACESWFDADSDATLALLDAFTGDAGLEARGWWTLAGVQQIVDTLVPTPEGRLRALTGWRSSLFNENGGGKGLETSLSTKARARAKPLAEFLAGTVPETYAAGKAIHEARGKRLQPIATELQRLSTDGKLGVPLHELCGSLMHMHCNRLLRSQQRRQELVVYDALLRKLQSDRARAKG